MTKFYYDIRDVFRAPRLALSGKKILLQFVGVLLGYVGYLIFTYIAFVASGVSISEVWRYQGLFPMRDFPFARWYQWAIFAVGCLWALICWILASTAVGKVTFEQLKGDDFYSTKESLRFLKSHWGPALLTPICMLAFIVFLFVCGIIVGLIGKIPFVGELGFSIFYLVPLFVAALFLAYVVFIFVISLLLSPAIVATLKEDTFETIVQVFTTVWNQAWRYFVYLGLIGVLAKVGMFIFGYFSLRAGQFIHLSAKVFMGDKLSDIMEEGLSYVTIPQHVLNYFSNVFYGIKFHYSLPEIGPGIYLNWSGEISSFLLGISLIFVIFMVFSYGLAIISTGQTITYIILRKKKDDDDLLERKTETEEEEEMREMEEKAKEEQEKEKTETGSESKACTYPPTEENKNKGCEP